MCTAKVPTKMDMKIDGYTYNEKDPLGKGTFGSVFKGKDSKGKDIAIKKVSLPEEEFRDDDEFMKNIERERIALEKMVHPNVVKLYHVKKEEDFIFFIIEFCDCNLDSYFKNATSVSLALRLQMMYEMALAVQYMHNMKPEPYVHRDIKPQNILLIIMGNKVVVKVADLGLARQMEYGKSKVNATACFTPYYEAPEMWPDKEGKVQYYIGVDVFALGILFEAILQTSPGQKLKPMKGAGTLSLGQWMSKKNDCGESVQPKISINVGDDRMDQQLSDLILCMLQQDPKQRITSDAVMTELRIIREKTQEECIHRNEGRGVLMTHNEEDFTLCSKPLVEPHDVHMEKVEEEVTYTTVCLDNALRLPFLDQAHKMFSSVCIKSNNCPLSFTSCDFACDKLQKLGKAVIKRASRIVEKSTSSNYEPRLSQEVISELMSIETVELGDKHKYPINDIKRFLETFGSHFMQGSFETVSSFEWVLTAESECKTTILLEIAEKIFQTCTQRPDVFEGSNSGMWYDSCHLLDILDLSRRQRIVLKSCNLRVMHNNTTNENMTFQKWLKLKTQTGTEQIPCMLNKLELVMPVWNLITECCLEFGRAKCLADCFEMTWQNLVVVTKHVEKHKISGAVRIGSTAAVDSGTQWMNLQKEIGIEKYYPCKLSLQDVIALDCHLSKPSSWNEIAWDMLKRLIMIDNRFLEKPFQDYFEEKKHQGVSKQMIIYPHQLDVMLLLYHACDFMLRQVLAKKLFMCRKAIPFIIPTENDQLQILLWPLRPIVLDWKQSGKAMEESLIKYPITRISFLKFGKSVFSKSNLINDILSTNGHRVFMTRESFIVLSERIISNGMVEMTHYSPAGQEDDVFSKPMMIFNLRGDATKFTNQTEIAAELSHIVVFFYDVTAINSKEVHEKLKDTGTKRIIILLTNVTNLQGKQLNEVLDEAEDFIQNEMELVNMILGFDDEGLNKNQRQIVDDLQKAIISALPHLQINSVEEAMQLGSHTVIIDEISNKDCMEGKKMAEMFMAEMETIQVEHVKETLLPLQVNIFKEMGSLLRRQYRERNQEEKNKVHIKINSLKPYSTFKLEKSFVAKHLLKPQIKDITRLFFTKWVQLELDNKCRSSLPQFQADYHQKWDNLMKTKKTKTADPSQITKAQEECKSAEEKVAAVGLGLEHLMREIGQIFQVIEEPKETHFFIMVASLLLMEGYPLEIMDGDNGFIPMQWVTGVLNAVSRNVGEDKKVFVLSVLGVQSSGKSTLLNSIFGLELAVSAGRCTRGIYAQMLPVNKKRGKQLPFDYLVVLDSEGLGAPELAHENTEHDNELATLVIGLADLTLINLNRESFNEIKDVLQIAVHALLRMQIADSITKRHCMFIQQNISVVNANVKMKYSQQKLQEFLDQITGEAAEALGWGQKFTLFNDVISFDGDKDMLYFPDFWNGDPPMATVNTNYSDMCVLVRKRILALNTNKQCTCITINDFVTRLKDMWKGVLAENFVFSFRNSLAANAYASLEQQCAKQRRLIESTLLSWINRECHIQIENCATERELLHCYNKMSTDGLEAKNIEKYADQLMNFIENHPMRAILEQWKHKTLTTFHINVELDKSYLKKLLVAMRDRKLVFLSQQAEQQKHEEEIMKKAIEYAEYMTKTSKSDSDIETTFELMWTKCSQNIMQKEVKKGPAVKSVFHILREVLEELFQKADLMYLNLQSDSHEPSTGSLEIPSLTQDDFVIKDLGHSSSSHKNNMIEDECNGIMKKIITTTKQIVDGIVKNGLKFHRSHGKEVFQSIFDQLDELNSRENERAIVAFKPSAKAKVCLVICDYAAEQFEKMNEEFERLHGVNAKVEEYKQKVFILFKDTVKQRLSEANAAEYLCEAIRPNIEKIVNKDMSRKVVDLILGDIGHVKFHLILRIMESFAKKKNFTQIMKYVSSAYVFATEWIKSHTNSTLLFKVSKYKTKYFEVTALHVKKIIDCIREGATKASEEKVIDLKRWITLFCEHAKQVMSITQHELKDLENYKITNFQMFGQLLEKRLSDLNTKINEELAKVTQDNVIWHGPNPYFEALNKLWGCNEQCPFCGEPCQRADADHRANHLCVQHRPNGINGVGHKHTKLLVVETCNMNVASDQIVTYRKITGNEDKHPFKEYKKHYPHWDIAPDDGGDASQYWKWIFCTFEKQIKNFYSDHELVIPESWHSITKKHALDSLRMYNP